MNKIIVSIILVVILVLGINKITDVIFHVEKPEKSAYQIASTSTTTTTETTSTSSSSGSGEIMALLASASVADGEKVFKKCKACHSIKQGGRNNIGPKLWNVMFRPVGAVTDYKYSKALAGYGKNWSVEELNGFLIKPASYLKGTKMAYAGLRKEKDRASVIKYLNQNGDNPLPLP